MHNAKKWVMRRCLIQGYEQVDLLTKKHRDDYWVEKRLMQSNAKDGIGVTSNKEMIRNTIDKLIPAVKSFEQLVEYLTGIYGWNIRVTDKTVTFTMPDMKRGIRGNKLGDGYGKAELIERIDIAVKEKAAIEAKRIAEENARAEAMRIAEERAKAEAEAREKVRIEAERKATAEKAELSEHKRKLAFKRNNIQFEYFMANADSDDWNSDYSNYLISEKITDYNSKTLEELSVPILTKEEFEQKQIEKMQEAISEKARELWNDALDNIDGSVYPNKWKYLDYLEEIRYRKVSTLTLQQVKEPVISFWEFNEMKERENVEATMQVESTQDVAVEVATDAQKDFEFDVTENDMVHKKLVVEPVVEDTVVVERVIEKTLTIEERAKEIATFIRNNYGKYDNVPVKVKAEQFKFSNNDLDADMELHSLVLKELNEKMYGADSFEDYMRIVDATEKKQSDELQKVDYYSNEKRWNRSR